MKAISCKEELITDRYDSIRKKITGRAYFSIFAVQSWDEPWGFGRDNKYAATVLYNEFMNAQDWDEVESITEAENCDEIIIVLRSAEDDYGIVWVAEDDAMLRESVEELMNHILRSETAPKVNSKPTDIDNIVISKMNLFK